MGLPGLYYLASLISNEPEIYLEKIIDSQDYLYLTNSKNELEDEILYGNAGYLYCLLKIYKMNNQNLKTKIENRIKIVFNQIYLSGKSLGSQYLVYSFPKGRKYYLGWAHGTVGILYILLKAI